jgi:ATP-dependent Clp protease, protease subunit
MSKTSSLLIPTVIEVNEHTANLVIAQLLHLAYEDPKKDIHLYINSPGGSVYDGLAIYDVMNYIKPDVSTVCVGMAASMGSFLLSAGTKGKRFMLPNSSVMIHQPSSGTQGTITDQQIRLEQSIKLKDKLTKMFAANVGQKYEKVRDDMERDKWLDADEALKYGIVDKVITKL